MQIINNLKEYMGTILNKPDGGFLEYMHNKVDDILRDPVLIILLSEYDDLKQRFDEGGVSLEDYVNHSVNLVVTIRSRPLGGELVRQYLTNN